MSYKLHIMIVSYRILLSFTFDYFLFLLLVVLLGYVSITILI